MKDLNLYLARVNLSGPLSVKGSATGSWCVCETSEKNAHKALTNYFNENHLIGNCGVGNIHLMAIEPDLRVIKRGDVIKRSDYYDQIAALKTEENSKPEFVPKRTPKGEELHRVIREGSDKDKAATAGAFGSEDDYSIDSCGHLNNIEGVTFNGKPLSDENLENIIDSIPDDMEI